jgi:hypothetical protein
MAMILSSCSCSSCVRADAGVGAADADLRVATISGVCFPSCREDCWRGVCFGPQTRLPIRLKAAAVTKLGLGQTLRH